MSKPQGDDDVRIRAAAGRTTGRVFGAPRLSRLAIERSTVLVRLDAAASESLCVVHAPSGYGKTTLLSQWARRRARAADGAHVFWITIDGASDDRYTFWESLFGLIRDADVADDLGVALIEPAADISASLGRLLERSFSALRHPVVIVVDGWENVSDPSLGDDVLRAVRGADRLTFVLGTRSIDHDLLVAAAPHGVGVLTADDLVFSVEEFRALAVRAGIPLEEDELRALVTASGGWPFALRQLLESTRDHLAFELNGSETLDGMRARLVDEVTWVAGHDYLLRTSVAESFTPELAEWLGADPTDAHVLDVVEARGLGTWEIGHDRRFRLQPLLREGLRARLDARTAKSAHRLLALWHERHGQLTRAFFSALDAEDATLAVRYAQQAFVPITVALHRNPDALTARSRAFFAGEPLLSLLNGLAHNIEGHTRKAMQRFATTIALSEAQLLAPQTHPDPDQVWIQGVMTAGLRLLGRYELVEPAYRRFRAMLEKVHDPEGVLDSAENVFSNESAVTLIYLDRLPEAELVLEEEIDPTGGRQVRAQFYPACLSILAQAGSGDIAAAEQAVAELEQASLPRQFEDSFYSVPLHLGKAHILLEQSRPDEALAEHRRCMQHWKNIEMWPLLLEVEIRAIAQKHGAARALAHFDERKAQKRKHPPISPAMSALLDALRAELQIMTGSLSAAHALAPTRRYRGHPRLAVPRARAFLIGGQPDRALAVVDNVKGSPRLLLRQRVELELIASSALLRIGEATAAALRFAEAARLALTSHLRLPFARIPRADAVALASESPFRDELAELLADLPAIYTTTDEVASLTRRETLVLRHLAGGEPLAEVAESLSVSVNTVKTQARSLYRKLGVTGRADAVAEARRRGLL